MTTIDGAQPAGAGELDEELFPMRQRLRLRDNFGLALIEFRQNPPFASIERGPWTVFIAIACSWQSHAEAWPTQETIAAFCGYTVRAVRDHIDDLERGGFIRLRRQRFRDGRDRLYYAPGRTTLAALIAFIERYPHDWTRARYGADAVHGEALSAGAPALTTAVSDSAAGPLPEAVSGGLPAAISAPLPEAVSGGLPAAISAKPREKLKEPSSWRSEPATTERAGGEEEQSDPSRITEEEREIAQTILSERIKRKHPGRKAPRLFETGEIELVVACSHSVNGDREAKLQAHREALEGAYLASQGGPPSVRFIWGKVEHFLDHAERGRRKLRAARRLEQAERARSEPANTRAARIRVETGALSEAQREFDRLLEKPGTRDDELGRQARGKQ